MGLVKLDAVHHQFTSAHVPPEQITWRAAREAPVTKTYTLSRIVYWDRDMTKRKKHHHHACRFLAKLTPGHVMQDEMMVVLTPVWEGWPLVNERGKQRSPLWHHKGVIFRTVFSGSDFLKRTANEREERKQLLGSVACLRCWMCLSSSDLCVMYFV